MYKGKIKPARAIQKNNYLSILIPHSVKFDEEILASLQQDLVVCSSYIKQVSLGMIKGSVTRFPIFVAMRSQVDLDIGLPIINREELELEWAVNASHLEDFVNSKIIAIDKVEDFKSRYKNPLEYMCVFVAEEGMMSFVFLPYERPQSSLEVKKEQMN
jgi:hypothetical protein